MKKIRIVILSLLAFLLCTLSVFADDLPDFENIVQNSGIPYDPETQKLVVIDIQSAPIDSTDLWDITEEELSALKDYMKTDKRYNLEVFINDSEMEYGSPYCIYNAKENVLRTDTYASHYDWTTSTFWGPLSAADENEYIILVLNKDDKALVTFGDILDGRPYYYDSEDIRHNLNGALIYRPTGAEDKTGYTVEGTDPVTFITYNYTWMLGVNLEFEWFYYSPELVYDKWSDTWYKYVDMPGNGFDIFEDVAFRIELRDKDGNIFPLPEGTMYTDGMYEDFLFSDSDGVLYDYADPERYFGYGECYTYIPVGYDYRVFIDSNGEALGTLGYIYSWLNGTPMDKDGFQGWDYRSWDGTFDEYRTIQFNFFPKNDTIRVEKIVDGKEDDNADYVFLATRDDIRFSNECDYTGIDAAIFETTVSYPLRHYPYKVYDAETDELVDPNADLKTDKEGKFTLKAGQYALFDVWELPEDFLDYQGGCNTIGDEISPDELAKAPHSSTYTFEELSGSDDYITSIFHNTDEVEGKLVEDVHNGDTICIVNKYIEKTGSIEINNTVSGNAADLTKSFYYTVTLSDKSICGKYGDVEFENGVSAVFALKHGEKCCITGLPVGVTFTVEESEFEDYTVTADGAENQIVAEGTVLEEERVVPFINVLNDEPTEDPEDEPTEDPEDEPTEDPEDEPTEEPEDEPTEEPEDEPTEDPEDEPTEDPNGSDIPPKTGDGSALMNWVAAAMISGLACVVFLREEKRRHISDR